jgi:hypothetical protein
MIITLVFKKNAKFFAENWEKSQKIVIITSTPGHPACDRKSNGSKPGIFRFPFISSPARNLLRLSGHGEQVAAVGPVHAEVLEAGRDELKTEDAAAYRFASWIFTPQYPDRHAEASSFY